MGGVFDLYTFSASVYASVYSRRCLSAVVCSLLTRVIVSLWQLRRSEDALLINSVQQRMNPSIFSSPFLWMMGGRRGGITRKTFNCLGRTVRHETTHTNAHPSSSFNITGVTKLKT